MSCEADTASILRASGQKVTPQRLLILSCARHAGGHITAPQIIETIRTTYPYIDASTVYRTLTSAKELGLVSETRIGSGDSLFEWVGGNRHHHLVCRVCGTVSSLDEHHLDELTEIVRRVSGFEADLGHIAIYGVCQGCAAKAAV
ncbi:MAG: transcriptional repressor [Dehalococcoidia bacterium]|nr:transcriptional repressor [Dehalococcoidia bacterium]